MQNPLDTLETKLQTDVYLHLVAFTFLYYDHILTFESEIRLIWRRPNTLSSYLFLFNRYFSFVGNIVMLISIFFTTSCHVWNMIQELFHAFVGLIIAVLLTLRIYALYDCNKRILLVLSVLILIGISLAVTMDLMASSIKSSSQVPSARCHDILSLKGAVFTSVGWEAILFYDILLLGMTLRKAYQVRGEHLERFGGMSLFSVAVRDGTIYYAIITLANFVNVLTFYVTGNSLLRASFSPIVSCMSVAVMSRLMLHLHEIAEQGLYINHAKTVSPSSEQDEYSMTFTSVWSTTQNNSTIESSWFAGP